MRRWMADYRLFLKEFRRTFHTTGAILPSSRMLARALARYVDAPSRSPGNPAAAPGRRILEVGPGTGAVTRQIVRRMSPDDRLDLVELNETFVRRLQDQFASDPLLKSVASRTEIMHRSIQDVADQPRYELIISGLPLNNFAVDEVTAILETFRQLSSPGGIVSFFEYVGVRPLRGAVAKSGEKQRLQGIGRVLGALFAGHEVRREAVWGNVPPAWVHHICFADEAKTS